MGMEKWKTKSKRKNDEYTRENIDLWFVLVHLSHHQLGIGISIMEDKY